LYRPVPSTALPIHLFRHFCYRMYRLATVHCVTDGRTDNIMMPIADHNAWSANNINNNSKNILASITSVMCSEALTYRLLQKV